MENPDFLLICDESGAQGYANNTEQHKGQLGVVSGYLIPGGNYSKLFKEKLESLSSFAANPVGHKTHITDITSHSAQERLRHNIFRFFKINRIPLFYGAIYVAAFNRPHSSHKRLHLESCAIAKANGLGISTNFSMPLLQSELFHSMYKKVYWYLAANGVKNPKILVVTDTVSNSTIKEYESQIQRVHEPFSTLHDEMKRYDYERDCLQTIKSSASIEMPEYILFPDIGNIKSSVVIDNSSLTFAADVLANSVHFELNKYAKESNFSGLESTNAIRGHMLHSQFEVLAPNKHGLSAIDRFYNYHTPFTYPSLDKINSDE